MLGRIFCSIDQDYKFGFNGEYKDDDVKGLVYSMIMDLEFMILV